MATRALKAWGYTTGEVREVVSRHRAVTRQLSLPHAHGPRKKRADELTPDTESGITKPENDSGSAAED